MTNDVTILIPCYNGEKFIKRCLDSCINQTYKKINILVVNDGSTDNSKKKLSEYENKYKNIKVISQENKGLASTRNILLNNMKTKYGFFLDVDDWIELDCIETFISSIRDKDICINSCFISKSYKHKKEYYISNKINEKTNNETYLINNTPFAWGILFNKKIFNDIKFNDQNQYFEDAGIMSYLIYKNNNISFINNPKYNYFINKNSLSRNKISKEKIISAINQLKNFHELVKNDKSITKIPKCLNDQFALYHCIVFTHIKFESTLSRKEKKIFKNELKTLEKTHFRIKMPKRYWKFWYFALYRLFFY